MVVDGDPQRLLERMRETSRDGDVHLVGGPRTIETFRALGALDVLGVIVMPLLVGDGMRLTPPVGEGSALTLESQRALAEASVEIEYAFADGAG